MSSRADCNSFLLFLEFVWEIDKHQSSLAEGGQDKVPNCKKRMKKKSWKKETHTLF